MPSGTNLSSWRSAKSSLKWSAGGQESTRSGTDHSVAATIIINNAWANWCRVNYLNSLRECTIAGSKNRSQNFLCFLIFFFFFLSPPPEDRAETNYQVYSAPNECADIFTSAFKCRKCVTITEHVLACSQDKNPTLHVSFSTPIAPLSMRTRLDLVRKLGRWPS